MFQRGLFRALTLATVVSLLTSTAVLADDISNDLDASIDAVAEVMALNVGGAGGSTSLYLTPRNGDGKNGCNLTGSTALVLSIASSNTATATVSPSSVTFTSCDDIRPLTVTPGTQGTATISASLTSNNSGGTFNLAPVTFTVNVAPPANTAPQVSVVGVTAGASYEMGSVPAATCDVVDAEDGNSTLDATLSAISGPLSTHGIGSQEASCSYTDGGGQSASSSVTYSIVDTTDPGITFVSRTPDANGNGWNNTNVTVTWSCSDGGSGVTSPRDSVTISTEGANQSATGTCTDNAGNTNTDIQSSISIDKTVPTVAYTSQSPAANANGWNNTDVAATFTATDTLSGFATGSTATGAATSAGEAESVLVTSATFTDLAGNTSGTASHSFKIDKTNPVVSDVGPTTDANSHGWYGAAVENEFQVADGLSGFAPDEDPYTFTVSTGTAEGTGVTVNSGTVSDLADNVSNSLDSAAFKIDLTDPYNVAFVGGPTDGGSYYFGSVPAFPTCTADDDLSGMASCVVGGYGTDVGHHVMTATATDRAGHPAFASASYDVLAWTGRGFYAPVDMGGVTNTVKAGSTVPLKFELFAGPTELTDTANVKAFTAQMINCVNSTVVDDIELTTTGATSLRYDSTGGQFIQNWQTPKKAGSCYRVTMTAQDGTAITALFKLK